MYTFTNALDLLEASAKETPQTIAVTDGQASLTYEELVNASKHAASGLLAHNPQASAVVIKMEKSCETLCAMMGALYAGMAYVPVDPSVPEARQGHILGALDAALVVTADGCQDTYAIRDLLDTPIDEGALRDARTRTLETDPAYIMFTSGSTGVPKGVVISHRAILSFIDAFVRATGLGARQRIGNQAPFDFDVSTKDIYGAFATGSTLVIIPRAYFMQPQALMDYLVEQRVTAIIWAVAALCVVTSYHALSREELPDLSLVAFSGEVMPLEHLKTWRAAFPQADFLNLYGPTEITCNCLYHRLEPGRDYEGGIPLGSAFPHCAVHLLDADGHEVSAPHEVGEIVVSGPSLALGYVGGSDEAMRAFQLVSTGGAYPTCVYRTGDLAMRSESGELFFCGRRDTQVKYLGHRIELEEIDAAVERVPGVTRCRCVLDTRRKRLCAFFEGTAEESDVRSHLRKTLPQNLCPTRIQRVEGMPLNKNGKVDRAQLLELPCRRYAA